MGPLRRSAGCGAQIVRCHSSPAVERMRISIMIATRNRYEELRQTLMKLEELRPPPDEILVCADGCTDGTAAIVRKQFPNCLLLENETGRGSIFSRDRMLRTASGDIVLSL